MRFLKCQYDVDKQKQRPHCQEPGLCAAGPAWRERRPRVQHAALEGGSEEAALHQRGQGPHHHLRGGRHRKLVHHPCLLPEAVWEFNVGPLLELYAHSKTFMKCRTGFCGFLGQADNVYGFLWIPVDFVEPRLTPFLGV